MGVRTTAGNRAAKARQGMSAKQVDASVQTNFEFAKELGATGYNEAGATAGGQGAGRVNRKAGANLRAGKYSR